MLKYPTWSGALGVEPGKRAASKLILQLGLFGRSVTNTILGGKCPNNFQFWVFLKILLNKGFQKILKIENVKENNKYKLLL